MSYKLLLVEDEPDLIELIRLKAQHENISVQSSPSPDRVLDILGHFRPDVILLDIHLQDSNGLDLLKKIRLQINGQKIPVIVYTADTQPQVIKKAYGIGANACFMKNGSFADLFSLLRQFVKTPVYEVA